MRIVHYKIWLSIVVFCAGILGSAAQDTIDIRAFEEFSYGNLHLVPEATYFEDSTNITDAAIAFQQQFKPTATEKAFKKIKTSSAWFQFILTNTLDTTYPLAFYYPRIDTATLYFVQSDSISGMITMDSRGFFLDDIKKNEIKHYLLKIENKSSKLGNQAINVYKQKDLEIFLFDYKDEILVPTIIESILVGAFFILFFYHFILYTQYRRKAYLYYCFYVLALAFYLGIRNPFLIYENTFNEVFLFYMGFVTDMIQPFFYIFYALFTRHFWQTHIMHPTFDKVLNLIIWISFITVTLISIGIFFSGINTEFIFDIYRAFMVFMAIGVLVYLYRFYDKKTKYYLIGSTIYLTFAIISFARIKFRFFSNIYIPVLHIGALLEIMLFAFGLGYQQRQIADEKTKTQQALIDELEKNENLQKQLEKSLKERLSVAEYEREIAQLESQILRSRMNPHFIFNSMNALKRFVLENKQEEASTYLNQFSDLLRQVLNNTGKKQIPLIDELEALENYLALEKNRLKNKFDYSISIDKKIDASFIEIPPMLLQPFVENAIWHGVRHLKERKGAINIEIKEIDDKIQINIHDNGIGREKSSQVNASLRSNHKSFATKLTKERLDLLETYDGIIVGFKIIDISNNQGTIVRLTLAN